MPYGCTDNFRKTIVILPEGLTLILLDYVGSPCGEMKMVTSPALVRQIVRVQCETSKIGFYTYLVVHRYGRGASGPIFWTIISACCLAVLEPVVLLDFGDVSCKEDQ